MPGPAAPPPGPGSVAAPAVFGAAGVLSPAWGHSLPAVAVEMAASVTAGAAARSANTHKAGELPPLQHIEDAFEQHRHLSAAESLNRGAAPPVAVTSASRKPTRPRPAPPQSQARAGLQSGPQGLGSVCNSISRCYPQFPAASGAFYAPSVREGLQPALLRTDSMSSIVSAATVKWADAPSPARSPGARSSMTPAKRWAASAREAAAAREAASAREVASAREKWLAMGRESTHPSPLPTPPPPPPPLRLPSEVGELYNSLALMSDADFDYAFSLALGVEH